MSRSSFSGPILSGTVKNNTYRNLGNSSVAQTTPVAQAGAGTQNITLYIPALSQITSFTVDLYTVWDSATSAALTIGTASGGTQFVSSLDVKTGPAGRMTITPTAAQLLAWSSVAQDNTATAAAGTPTSSIVITLVATGATTAGSARVTVHYLQYDDRQGYQNV